MLKQLIYFLLRELGSDLDIHLEGEWLGHMSYNESHPERVCQDQSGNIPPHQEGDLSISNRLTSDLIPYRRDGKGERYVI